MPQAPRRGCRISPARGRCRCSGIARSTPSGAGRTGRSGSPASCRSGTDCRDTAGRSGRGRPGEGPSRLSESRFPQRPGRTRRVEAAAGCGPVDFLPRQVMRVIECAGIPEIARLADARVDFDVLPVMKARQGFAVLRVQGDLGARVCGSSSRRKRSRSPEIAGGSTTQPPRTTISRPSTSNSGAGPGMCAT